MKSIEEPLSKAFGVRQIRVLPKELQLTRAMSLGEFFDEAAPKQA